MIICFKMWGKFLYCLILQLIVDFIFYDKIKNLNKNYNKKYKYLSILVCAMYLPVMLVSVFMFNFLEKMNYIFVRKTLIFMSSFFISYYYFFPNYIVLISIFFSILNICVDIKYGCG